MTTRKKRKSFDLKKAIAAASKKHLAMADRWKFAPPSSSPEDVVAANYCYAGIAELTPDMQQLREAGWPSALAKATVDDYSYFALIDGLGPITFSSAQPAGIGWV